MESFTKLLISKIPSKMEENIFLVVDYNSICRLCLHSTDLLTNLFANDEGISLVEQIFHVTGLQITEDDELPPNICHKCQKVVKRSHELRETALNTYRLLVKGVNYPNNFLNCLKVKQDNEKENRTDKTVTLAEQKEKARKHGFATKRETCLDDGEQDGSITKRAPKHFQCQICLSSFDSKQQVSSHVATHYTDSTLTPYLQMKMPYECEICDSGNIKKKELILHHRKHLNINPYVCKHPGCDYVGKNQDTLRHHAIIHSARSQVCEQCGAMFRRRWEVRQHAMRAHAGAFAACRVCRAVCRNALAAQAHVRSHRRAVRFECGWRGCPKSFPSPHALAAHGRAHAAHRRYRCTMCAAAYTSQSLLNRHTRLHERVRMSKCDKCPLTFDDYGAFYSHRVAAHGPWQPHRCRACNTGYQSEARLEKHMSRCELAAQMQAPIKLRVEEDDDCEIYAQVG